MERYKVNSVIEVTVSTYVNLEADELKQIEGDDLAKRKKLEALARDKMRIESYEGNGGHDKLIGVIGRDNAIKYDKRYIPRLIDIQRM